VPYPAPYVASGRAAARAPGVPPARPGYRTGMSDEATITPYRDGPLLVRGPFRLVDQDGNDITVDRETIALCRCGKSRLRPFCDGTHKLVRFSAPSGPERR
jgi:CDGSH-type Zn-finger protein